MHFRPGRLGLLKQQRTKCFSKRPKANVRPPKNAFPKGRRPMYVPQKCRVKVASGSKYKQSSIVRQRIVDQAKRSKSSLTPGVYTEGVNGDLRSEAWAMFRCRCKLSRGSEATSFCLVAEFNGALRQKDIAFLSTAARTPRVLGL